MPANVAEGAKDILVTAGVGVFAATTGWGIFIGKMPTDPDQTITLNNTGGPRPNPLWLQDFLTFQARVRGPIGDYITMFNKAIEVMDELLGLPSQDINGDRWASVIANSNIADLGFDDTNRPMCSINFRAIIEPASGTYRLPL